MIVNDDDNYDGRYDSDNVRNVSTLCTLQCVHWSVRMKAINETDVLGQRSTSTVTRLRLGERTIDSNGNHSHSIKSQEN